jgi:hypothetical protein
MRFSTVSFLLAGCEPRDAEADVVIFSVPFTLAKMMGGGRVTPPWALPART